MIDERRLGLLFFKKLLISEHSMLHALKALTMVWYEILALASTCDIKPLTCVKLRPTFNIWHSILQKPIPRNVQIKCKKYWTTVINLRAEAIVRSISDAIFLLPVTRSSSPNVHSLSQWRILLFVRTTSYVIITISLQKHSSPGTTVLTDYKQRHISTSGWAQNAAKSARLESMGKLHTTIAP